MPKKGYKMYKGSNIHSKVINEYKQDKTLKEIGWNLDELRKARNRADYDEDRKIDKHRAGRMLILAKQVLNDLDGLL